MSLKKMSSFVIASATVAMMIGCSENGITPLSVGDNESITMATVGSSGATFVSQCGSRVFAVGKDVWPDNNKHKIYQLSGTQWIPMLDYANIDAHKVGFDPATNEMWIIDVNRRLWKGLTAQTWTAENNWYGKTGPIYVHDVVVAGNGYPYFLMDEVGTYGYVIYYWQASTQTYNMYYNTIDGSGVALAPNPTEGEYSGDLWVVRNNGQLWLWNCSNMVWEIVAYNCLGTSKADVSVATNGDIFVLTNTASGSDWKIKKSSDHGLHWSITEKAGVRLGASDRGWMVDNAAKIYKWSTSTKRWILY